MIIHHGLATVFHLPRLGSALADNFQYEFHIEPSLLAKGNALGQALHHACNTDLIDHLGKLAAAVWAHAGEGLGKCHCDRLGLLKVGKVAPDHDGECAVDSARLAP